MIKLINVNKYYKSGNEKIWAIKNLNLTFPETGLVFILGQSGCGKSTLLNLLGGLDRPDSGEILIENKSLSSFSKTQLNNYLNSYLGFVFQEYNIFQDLNLFENISLPLEMQGIKRDEINNRVNTILDQVELTPYRDRKINQLSGGQRQRIAIARALVKNPKLIIADEPTGNLDSVTGDNIFEQFKKFSSDRLIIIVSHDVESAMKFGDYIVKIDDGALEEIIDQRPQANMGEPTPKELILTKARVPIAISTKLSLKRIWKKKIRFLVMSLICALSLAFLSFSIELTSDPLRQNAYTMKENEFNYVNIFQKIELPSSFVKTSLYDDYSYTSLPHDSYDKIKEAVPELELHQYQTVNIPFKAFTTGMLNYFFPDSLQNLIRIDPSNDYDLLAGRLPRKDSKEILISDYLVELFTYYNMYPGCSNPYDYLGKVLDLQSEKNYIIVGVVNTPYEKWSDFILTTGEAPYDKNNKQYLPFTNDMKVMNAVYLDGKYFDIEKLIVPNTIPVKKYPCFMMLTGNSYTTTDFYNLEDSTFTTKDVPLHEFSLSGGRTASYGRFPENENEITISGKLARLLLGINPTATSADGERITEEMENKAHKITLEIFNDSDELIATKVFYVVGITKDVDTNKIQVGTADQALLYQTLNAGEYLLANLPYTQEATYNLFNKLAKNGFILDIFAYRNDIDSFTVDPFIDLVAKVGLFIFAIFAIGILWTIITLEIVDSRKDIGIFRSIGLSGSKVSFIFIFQTFIIGIISFSVALLVGNFAINYYSSGLMDELGTISLSMYMLTYRSPIFLFLFLIFIMSIAIVAPLYKIMAQKIIDVINERDDL